MNSDEYWNPEDEADNLRRAIFLEMIDGREWSDTVEAFAKSKGRIDVNYFRATVKAFKTKDWNEDIIAFPEATPKVRSSTVTPVQKFDTDQKNAGKVAILLGDGTIKMQDFSTDKVSNPHTARVTFHTLYKISI